MTIWTGVTALVLSAAAASASTPAPGQSSTAPKDDPNRIICEKVQETGSRLNARKTCMTAAQWVEQRKRDREAVEDAQRQKAEPAGK
ncbi:MAG TPA: hypothetical protein VF079_04430 [Sphingomicrobium sp.]